jgi:hypothetical protein
MTINWISYSYTYSVHHTACKFQVCVSVFICSSLSMTSSSVCVYTDTVLCFIIIWIHSPSTLTSCSFLTWLSIGFLILIHTRFITQPVSFKFVYPCLYAHLCQWLPPASAHTVLCFIIIWILTIHIDFLFISDMAINWISYAYSVHLTACKFKFVYPCLYDHLCQWLPPPSAYTGLCLSI